MSELGDSADDGRHELSAFKRLYDVEEFSDVRIIIPGRQTIHAHKVILAAGSGYFRSKFQLPIYTEGLVATLELEGFDPAFLYIAIRHLYGFDCMAKPGTLGTLDGYLELCALAVQWDIEGLLDSAFKAADGALTYCLDVEDEDNVDYLLVCFFGAILVVPDDDEYTQHLLGILGPHLTKLYTKPRFLYLLDNSPNMVRYLLGALVKDKALRESSGL